MEASYLEQNYQFCSIVKGVGKTFSAMSIWAIGKRLRSVNNR